MAEQAAYTGHVDTFCADHLPPAELCPVQDWFGIPAVVYPPRLNCAAVLVDDSIARGQGERPAIRFPGGVWSYVALQETVSEETSARLVQRCQKKSRDPANKAVAAHFFQVEIVLW